MKKKLDILLTSLCLLVLYNLKPLWEVVENKIIKPLLPFFVSFLISYFIYPLKQYLKNKYGNKISIIILIILIISLLTITLYLIIPLLYKESIFLINTTLYFIKNISLKYNIDLSKLTNKLIEHIDITASYKTIINIFVVICLTIYILIDMEKIRTKIKKYIKNKNYYIVLKESDKKIKKYIKSIFTISIITLIEYFILYKIINHPNTLLLSILASALNIIPYFGGILFGLIALLASQTKQMVIKTIIVIFITSILDTYIINPLTFKKSNNINPILNIIGMLLFGSLFGTIGIILTMPILITLKEYIQFCRIKNELKNHTK